MLIFFIILLICFCVLGVYITEDSVERSFSWCCIVANIYKLLKKIIVKNYRTILLAISLLLSLFSFAQSRKAFFYGLAKDHVTQEVLTKVNVSVYKDTVLVSKNDPNSNVNISGNSGFWILEIPKEGGVYRFTFSKQGYEFLEKTVEVLSLIHI